MYWSKRLFYCFKSWQTCPSNRLKWALQGYLTRQFWEVLLGLHLKIWRLATAAMVEVGQISITAPSSVVKERYFRCFMSEVNSCDCVVLVSWTLVLLLGSQSILSTWRCYPCKRDRNTIPAAASHGNVACNYKRS